MKTRLQTMTDTDGTVKSHTVVALASGKGTLPNYYLKISVIMTLSLGPPPSPPLSVMAKVADSHTC